MGQKKGGGAKGKQSKQPGKRKKGYLLEGDTDRKYWEHSRLMTPLGAPKENFFDVTTTSPSGVGRPSFGTGVSLTVGMHGGDDGGAGPSYSGGDMDVLGG
eukprot:Hpha_TRINITY_DN30888_c0_g1::TRINITY_DN30888_c0_g1_i1::g.155745::m.155745